MLIDDSIGRMTSLGKAGQKYLFLTEEHLQISAKLLLQYQGTSTLLRVLEEGATEAALKDPKDYSDIPTLSHYPHPAKLEVSSHVSAR
ncbi:uncharacterized protein RAG0_14386 [Rhynchosporium agropyri]|uniref:Uncharacterized protein n=1 Tax=Rhynchosporium agropyri TaxID=914238 RepID=A0A1E1LGT8_9HELO|nr:uncharacterized protein RAG0_14386 [Rhynchosporium agropyri]